MANFARVPVAAIAATLLTLAGAQAVFAQVTQEERSAIRAACPVDYEKHCASVPPGGEASLQCLQENVDSLDADCKAAVEAATKSQSSN